MERRGVSFPVFLAALVFAGGCATTQGAAGGDGLADDECSFEVTNQTEHVVGVSISSPRGPEQVELRMGERYRFRRSCDGGQVTVTAVPRPGPEALPGARQSPRGRVIERTVAPQPGRVVQIPLRGEGSSGM